ncbi:MAG: 4Fe-4S binding protein [Candidatus Omnitrophica bacterium]|nr:4Fe-4S binding protein [Candidatus Omnitrophota bacterium]
MSKRKIIKIDEDKCNGCGQCVPNCAEGALQIINEKARLVSEVFCDGLGACIGHCPEGAITIEEREVESFDKKKAHENLHAQGKCPGSKVMDLNKSKKSGIRDKASGTQISQLGNWPLQIRLVPVFAPYFNGADLLVAADCVPFVYADFHNDLLSGKVLLVGCPKLDDAQYYSKKLTDILKQNDVKSITSAHMEVPCCFGLVSMVKGAIAASGKKIPFKEVTVSIKGDKI